MGHKGTIVERTRKNGGVAYQAQVKIPGGKAAVGTFDTRELAQAFIDDILNSRQAVAAMRAAKRARPRTPEVIDEENQELYDEEWLRTTLKLYAESGEMAERNCRALPTILGFLGSEKLNFVGDAKLKELKRKWVKDYISFARKQTTRRKKPFAWSTIAGHLKLISMALKWRAEELEITRPRLPFSTSMLPDGWEVRRDRRLKEGEENRIVARLRANPKQSKHHWLRLFRLSLDTAARLQELTLATWDEFNFEGRFWTIPAEHSKTKTTRVVPLTNRAMRTIKALKFIASPNDPRVFHTLKNAKGVSAVFGVMLKKSGIVGLRLHDLRHEAVSRMVLRQRQLSVFEIMGIVGHSSLSMLKRYSNLRGDELSAKLV